MNLACELLPSGSDSSYSATLIKNGFSPLDIRGLFSVVYELREPNCESRTFKSGKMVPQEEGIGNRKDEALIGRLPLS
jgi:hypothetical protein